MVAASPTMKYGKEHPDTSCIHLSTWAYQVSSFLNWTLSPARADQIAVRITPLALEACALIDGQRTTDEIIAEVTAVSASNGDAVKYDFVATLCDLVKLELVLLMSKEPETATSPTADVMRT